MMNGTEGHTMKSAKTVTVDGHTFQAVNSFSSGPGCEPHTYELPNGALVRKSPVGWIMEYRGQGEWIPEISGFAIKL